MRGESLGTWPDPWNEPPRVARRPPVGAADRSGLEPGRRNQFRGLDTLVGERLTMLDLVLWSGLLALTPWALGLARKLISFGS
jgi:hypothetical protein